MTKKNFHTLSILIIVIMGLIIYFVLYNIAPGYKTAISDSYKNTAYVKINGHKTSREKAIKSIDKNGTYINDQFKIASNVKGMRIEMIHLYEQVVHAQTVNQTYSFYNKKHQLLCTITQNSDWMTVTIHTTKKTFHYIHA